MATVNDGRTGDGDNRLRDEGSAHQTRAMGDRHVPASCLASAHGAGLAKKKKKTSDLSLTKPRRPTTDLQKTRGEGTVSGQHGNPIWEERPWESVRDK